MFSCRIVHIPDDGRSFVEIQRLTCTRSEDCKLIPSFFQFPSMVALLTSVTSSNALPSIDFTSVNRCVTSTAIRCSMLEQEKIGLQQKNILVFTHCLRTEKLLGSYHLHIDLIAKAKSKDEANE